LKNFGLGQNQDICFYFYKGTSLRVIQDVTNNVFFAMVLFSVM